MGIPYSKQINLAFDHVTPLVAAGFQVLQTTKNITYLLAAIQVLTAIFLGLILIALLALIITVNPELEYERQIIVTPAMRWITDWIVQYGKWVKVGMWIVIIGATVGSVGGWYATKEGAGLGQVDVEVEDPDEETEGETAAA